MAASTHDSVPTPVDSTGDAPLDELLQRSRRLDWRFLLPNPDLGRVVYFGPASGDLWDALGYFAQDVIDGQSLPAGASEQFDTAVLEGQSIDTLARVGALLRPGGVLYAELRRRVGREIPWQVRRFASAAERAGFRQIETFWHWPDFAACTKIIPLDDPSGVCNVVTTNRHGATAWLIQQVTRAGFGVGLTGWFVSCISVLARRANS